MFSDWFDRARGLKDQLPNRFTIAMGELVRQARAESKMSQAELAEKAYLNQAAISLIEKGKREVSVSEVVYLSYALNKPITYFFHDWIGEEINVNSLTNMEKELILHSKRLNIDDLKRLIAQAKALADLAASDK